MTRIALAVFIAVGLSGCDGGGGGGDVRRSHGIGANPPPLIVLDTAEAHDAVAVSYGETPDPGALTGSYLVSYLRSDADDDYEDTGGALAGLIRKFETPPTIRVTADTPPELVDQVATVVREMNAALPNNWQLTFSSTPAPRQPDHNIDAPDGEIHVQFSPRAEWSVAQDAAGFAQPSYQCVGVTCQITIKSGRVYVDPSITTGRLRERVIAHELLHTLGRLHIDAARFPDTIMDVSASSEDAGKPILDRLDREALLAVYGSLSAGTSTSDIESDLGPWATDAMQIRGDLVIARGEIVFGASARNGRIQPWVTGPLPGADIVDNDGLGGSATYTGRLLGFTNDASTIGGQADLSVRLATLDGDLSFTGLETWLPGTAPGAPGTGAAFGAVTGIGYDIAIEGNAFSRTGGDDGIIDGRFFGAHHQGMGGTVRRNDFAGAFAGKR